MSRFRSQIPSIFHWEHPWGLEQLGSCSSSELRSVYDQIERALHNGGILPGLESDVRLTQRRIRRVLQGRDLLGPNTLDAWYNRLEDSGDLGFLHRASPDFVIGQTVQQRVINLPALQPNIAIQTIQAPSPNITFQTMQPPQPVAPLMRPELPKRLRFRDQWGNIVEERDETEQEKSDREYQEWKEKFGVK
ncbi:unnamed protein product [Alternaria burnsii]|nr:unnamed protein product [Alternaria burnsii]